MTEAGYRKFTRPYERALRQLLLDLEFFCEDVPGITVHSVHHRIKAYQSVLMKLQSRSDLALGDLQDIAGLRIIVGTLADGDVIVRFFSRQEYDNALKILSDDRVNRNGYRGRHLVIDVSPLYTRSAQRAIVEVQIHTLVESAFNTLSRNWTYKTSSPSGDWPQRFKAVSDKLKKLDVEISALQLEVIEASATDTPDAPLSPYSYQLIVRERFEESVALDDCVDAVRLFIDFGFGTNGLIRAFFNQPRVEALYQEMKQQASDKGERFFYEITSSKYLFFTLFGRNIEAAEGMYSARARDHSESQKDQ